MMSSYEVVCRAIEFEGPDRLPLRVDALGMSDVHTAAWNQIVPWDPHPQKFNDEWECGWARTNMSNMGQVKYHPLADWSALVHYNWPDPDDPSFYEDVEKHFEGADSKYVVSHIFMLLFERMHALHGFENTIRDLFREYEKVEILADQIVEFDLGIIRNIAKRFRNRIHGITFTDDWGTQQGVFINPELWDRFFKPRYKRLFDAIHQEGWHVWMHSCGKINAIVGRLIEIGLDVLNLQQPRALGIEEIGRQFGGHICFESLCDIQQTLPYKGTKEIKEEALLLIKHWTTSKGGFILSDYGQGEAIGVDIEKKKIMLDAFLSADPFRKCQRV